MPARTDLARARHVLVTGAAGAIGSAIAREVAAAAPEAVLTLVDKRVAEHGLGSRARAVTWDLAAPEALAVPYGALAPVDVLVNCAGFMELVSFAGTSWELGRALLDVDLVSPLRLMSLAVPGMKARGFGVVVNVTSMAGLVPIRGSSYYGAAKAGLAMASEVAHIELRQHGVHVVTVYPGPVRSELERRARAQVRKSLASIAVPTGDPHKLATLVLRAVRKGAPRVIYPSFYEGAAEMLPIARRFTALFSPSPHA
jgi:short-subunit dehydrogenase